MVLGFVHCQQAHMSSVVRVCNQIEDVTIFPSYHFVLCNPSRHLCSTSWSSSHPLQSPSSFKYWRLFRVYLLLWPVPLGKGLRVQPLLRKSELTFSGEQHIPRVWVALPYKQSDVTERSYHTNADTNLHHTHTYTVCKWTVCKSSNAMQIQNSKINTNPFPRRKKTGCTTKQ